MNKDNNIQSRVVRTVLEDEHKIVLGGKTYYIAPPSLGTLIRASEMIATMPDAVQTRKGREFQDILASAKDFKSIAEFAAVLILGAKKAKEPIIITKRDKWYKRKTKAQISRAEALATDILDNVSPEELKNAIVPLLEGLQLNDFFITTTFLSGINVTQPTKRKAGTKATASGQSSAASSNTTG